MAEQVAEPSTEHQRAGVGERIAADDQLEPSLARVQVVLQRGAATLTTKKSNWAMKVAVNNTASTPAGSDRGAVAVLGAVLIVSVPAIVLSRLL